MKNVSIITLIIFFNITCLQSAVPLQYEIRPQTKFVEYDVSEPILEYHEGETMSYYEKKSNMNIYGSDFMISKNDAPLKFGIGLFYGYNKPVITNNKSGSILNNTSIQIYLAELQCEYNKDIAKWISGTLGIAIGYPYMEYTRKELHTYHSAQQTFSEIYTLSDVRREIICGIKTKVNFKIVNWLIFYLGLDYNYNIPKFKKINAYEPWDGVSEPIKYYSVVDFRKMNYQIGFGVSF